MEKMIENIPLSVDPLKVEISEDMNPWLVSHASEFLRYLDQLAKSQCRVTFSVPERETQNQFSCRGDVTLPRVFTAQVKVKHESNARPKTTRGLFNQPGFLTFSANFTNKIEQKFQEELVIKNLI